MPQRRSARSKFASQGMYQPAGRPLLHRDARRGWPISNALPKSHPGRSAMKRFTLGSFFSHADRSSSPAALPRQTLWPTAHSVEAVGHCRALAEALDALEDVVGRFRPSEGLGIAVADVEEAADVPLELHHAVMGSALDHLVGEKPTSSACLPPSHNGASVVPADSRCASSRVARRPKSGAILRSRFSQDHEGLYKLPGDR